MSNVARWHVYLDDQGRLVIERHETGQFVLHQDIEHLLT